MIIFEDKAWQTSTETPNTNYLEELDCEQPKWIVDDNSDLARKIMSTPYWEPVEDEIGQLVDIAIVEPPLSSEESIALLKSELEEIDRQAIRPLRAIAAGNDIEEDREILADLEQYAEKLRGQLADLEKTLSSVMETPS